MKILFVAPDGADDASASDVRAVALQWLRAGHQVMVLVPSADDSPTGQPMSLQGLAVIQAPRGMFEPTVGFVRSTLAAIAFLHSSASRAVLQFGPDVVVTRSSRLSHALLGWLLSRRRDIPWVFEAPSAQLEATRRNGALLRSGAMASWSARALQWTEARRFPRSALYAPAVQASAKPSVGSVLASAAQRTVR